jgi:peptide/nickel transport system ATP-binding protein
MKELLQIRNLNVKFYTYDGVVQALDNLNIDINQRETFGLVGETGCGKTVTALSILRLVPPPGRIESGSIFFNPDKNGETIDLLAVNENKIRAIRGSGISMVFQEPSAALDPVYTIDEQISEALLIHRQKELCSKTIESLNEILTGQNWLGWLVRPIRRFESNWYKRILQEQSFQKLNTMSRLPLVNGLLGRFRSEAQKMAVNMLKEIEMPDAERIAKQYPHELSGGMKQRAVIAMALAGLPRLLIADEPTTALDVTIQAQILQLLRRLKQENETSILYITHDLGVAAEICDRVGVMYAGTLCEIASVVELYASPLHPYTKALLNAIPKPGKTLQSIRGSLPDLINPPSGCRFHPRCSEAKAVCYEKIPYMHEEAPGHFIACHIE